ncbi:hypothetical protein [Burkholderia pseudomallei]|uniref:hypothetical protein n=1 Tax=Burkholderia pseudomallei TaxID=28450 RepID=UPI003F660314
MPLVRAPLSPDVRRAAGGARSCGGPCGIDREPSPAAALAWRWRRCRLAAMDAGRGRDRGIAWPARNAGAAMPRPAPSVNVADISTNCATEPANFVGRLIAIRSLSRRRVRHRHPAVEADREPQSCRRRAESRRASAANKYSIASMHAPSRTEAHRGGTGPAFGSGLTGPHRMTATAGRFDS